MRIRRIRVENFRTLRRPICIDGLGDGLTVIAGDNEDGKSTLLDAVRAALFCRHTATGKDVDAMQPFDCKGARPRVELDFALDGCEYRLRKAFCEKPLEAELITPRQRFQRNEAEEELCRLLGFSAAKKGATRPDEQGVWGLFWVEQGTTFLAEVKVGETGRATLTRALEDEMGRVLGGDDARALGERVRLRCAELFSDKKGEARGDLKLCRERANEAAQRVEALQSQVGEYHAKASELQRLRDLRAQHDREQTLARAEASLGEARAAEARIADARRRVDEAKTQVELAKAKLDRACETWRQRRGDREQAGKAIKAAAGLAAEVEAARQSVEPLRARQADAEGALTAAREARAAAQAALAGAERALRKARAQHELASARQALQQAEQAEAAAAAAQAEAASILVDDAGIERLRALAGEAARARAKLDAAETEVRFAPEPGRRVFADGREIAAGMPLRLAAETVLRLEGFGMIIVRPGGEDLGDRQRALAAAEAAITTQLDRLGIETVTAAEAAWARRNTLLAAAEAGRRGLASLAPQGLEVLRETAGARAEELAELQDGLPALAVDAAQAAFDRARADLDAAELALETLQLRRDDCARQLEEAERALVARQAASDAATGDAKARQDQLAASRADVADQTLLTVLQDEQDNYRNATARAEQAGAALGACDPDGVAARLAAAERGVAETCALLKGLDDDALELQGELRGLGQRGLEELLAAARGELQRAERERAVVERRAAALRLLQDTLREVEAGARQSFAGPIAARMAPYLQALFPGTDLEFAPDTLQVRHLRRNERAEPFERLSVGTREQLAVLTRLAFAELLADRQRPALVILDDALVYSDRRRLGRMQDILLRASEKLQVLLLTCREDDYDRLARAGVPIRRLADCRELLPAE